MTGGFDLVEPPAQPSPRSAKRKAMFVTLAGILAIAGTLAGGLLLCDAAGDVADRGRSGKQR